MCRAMEEMRNEAAREAAVKAAHERSAENAKTMLESGKLTYEEIAKFSSLPLEEVKALDGQKSA